MSQQFLQCRKILCSRRMVDCPRVLGVLLLLGSLYLALCLDKAGVQRPIESVVVFRQQEANYSCYRIPALVRLPTGELALYAEARKFSCGDSGHIDLVYRLSADNGTTWGPIRLLHGESTDEKHVTIGNPAPVIVDGRVLLTFSRDNHQILTLKSEDAGGRVWPSTPLEITEQIFNASSVHWVSAFLTSERAQVRAVWSSHSPSAQKLLWATLALSGGNGSAGCSSHFGWACVGTLQLQWCSGHSHLG
eukprot:scaffold170790_cov31-Tisochrysis_lutea.AAC.4